MGRFKMFEQLKKEKEEQGLSATKNFITLDNLKVDREEEAYWSLPYKFQEFQPLNACPRPWSRL